MTIFLSAFIGNFLALGIVGAIVFVAVRKDIDRAKQEMNVEMERGRELMASFLAATNEAEEFNSSNDTIN